MMNNYELLHKQKYLQLNNLCDVEKYIIDPKDVPFQSYSKDFKFNITHDEDNQVPGSSSHYNDPKYKSLQFEIKNKLQDILGKRLYKTYYYDRIYYQGQALFPHFDRPSCEVSITMHLSSNISKPWPLGFVDENGKEKYVEMNSGDAILYLGCDVEHFRNPLKSRYGKRQQFIRNLLKKKDDTYYHQIFFHYVYSDGKFSHFANDTSNK